MLHEKWFAIMPIVVVLSFANPAFADSVEDHIRDLKDENSTVRAMAAEALGGLEDVRAVEPLIEALNDTDVFVQESAAQALRSIEDVKGIDPVMNVLKVKDTDTHVRVELYGLLREEVNGVASCESIDLSKLKKMNDTGYEYNDCYVDAEGLIQGPYVQYYDEAHTKIEMKGCYLDSNRFGSWISYWDNGNIESKGDYTGEETHTDWGVRTGPWIFYHENGNMSEEGYSEDGKRTGQWISYWDNGKIMSKGDYENGNRTGPWINYWKNGNIRSSGSYKYGKEMGAWIFYWDIEEAGQIQMKGDYRDGLETGRWIHYVNGRKYKEGDYKDGRKTGQWVYYDRDEEVEKIEDCVNGECTKID